MSAYKTFPIKLVLITVILASAVTILVLGILNVRNLENKIRVAKGEMMQLKGKEFSLKAKAVEVVKYEEFMAKIDQQFVDSRDPRNFLKFIHDEEEKNSIKARIDIGSQKVSPLVLLVSCDGVSSGCLNFLDKIESGPWMVEASDIFVQQGASDQIHMTFKLTALVK